MTAAQVRPAPLPTSTPLPVDAEGHRYLPGPHRPLPPGSGRALEQVPADANGAAFTVLLGAVRARWHLADVIHLLDKPGLEHVRTERQHTQPGVPPDRRPRDPRTRQRLLSRQWDRAVDAVLASPDRVASHTEDPSFPGRAAATAAAVAAVQARADASPGRWTSLTGPATRRVLDALCLLAVTAITMTVEADTRRLALLTGLSRETARTRLHQLTKDGWISLHTPATGQRGHRWTLVAYPASPAQMLHPQPSVETRSQGVPPPGVELRSALRIELTSRG